MMKARTYKWIFLNLLIVTSICGCTFNKPETEFIADDNTFSDFTDWQLEKTYYGPDPLLHTLAHLDNDASVVRNVYLKNGQEPIDGKYPKGTLVVKHSYNPSATINEYVAMAKRGNGYNPSGNDWEFFMLSPDGKILLINEEPARGTNLLNGLCLGCHASVSNKDYIFSK